MSDARNRELTSITAEYKSLKTKAAASESKSFIKEYIGRETWRFFIDGERQNEGPSELKMLVKRFGSSIKDLKVSDVLEDKLPQKFKFSSPEDKNLLKATVESKVKHLQGHDTHLTIEQFYQRICGWIPFEATEPGYLKPLANTLLELENTKEDLNTDFITALHKNATHEVKKLNYDRSTNADSDKSSPGNFRDEKIVSYPLSTSNTTKNGVEEIFKNNVRYATNDKYKELSIAITYHENKEGTPKVATLNRHDIEKMLATIRIGKENIFRLKSEIKPEGEKKASQIIGALIEDLLKTYDINFKRADTPEKKIRCIVTLIRDLEQLHPFADANCRTLCMLLLSHLLMQNGFPPPILINPNHFDAYSVDELTAEVIQGMKNTMDIATKRKDKLFDISTDQVLKVATDREATYATSLGITPSAAKAEAKASKSRGFFSFLRKEKPEGDTTPTSGPGKKLG